MRLNGNAYQNNGSVSPIIPAAAEEASLLKRTQLPLEIRSRAWKAPITLQSTSHSLVVTRRNDISAPTALYLWVEIWVEIAARGIRTG